MKNTKNNKEKTLKIFMYFLFFLTIFSFFGSLALWGTINERPENVGGFLFTSTTFVCWLCLPLPILSIILGYKYKKLGIKCTKNIVAGYIITILLILYGSFCLISSSDSKDYSKINSYKKIINAPLPSNGRLELFKWDYNSDHNKTNYKTIYINYFNEDTRKLEDNIKKNDTWILSTEMEEKLRFLVSDYITGKNIYFSIYNRTLNKYNTLPTSFGNYKIYTMMYDTSKKLLQIDEFNYNYN